MNVLLVDQLPSAHRSQKNYKVAILYRPTNLPSGPNDWLGYPGESGHIKAVCCGPSVNESCIAGARIEPCAHGATILKLGCVIPLHQVNIKSYRLYIQHLHINCSEHIPHYALRPECGGSR